MSATQVKMERETMFKYKKQVQELEKKILETEQKLIKRGLEKSSLKIENAELKANLALAEGEWRTYAKVSEQLSAKLVLAEAEITSRGENFNRIADHLDIAIAALKMRLGSRVSLGAIRTQTRLALKAIGKA